MKKLLVLVFIFMVFSAPVYAGYISGSWDASPEPDVAGYKVYVGAQSGNYQKIWNVGKRTSVISGDIFIPRTYFIVVTAYDTSGNESAFSTECVVTVTTPIDSGALDLERLLR